MGRDRKYNSNKERQKAYRLRKHQQRFTLIPGGGKADPEALKKCLDDAIEQIRQRLETGRCRR
jgi:hypothetical protein